LIYTENIIPAMTSDTAPSGVATSSGDYNSTYANWKVFDRLNPAGATDHVWFGGADSIAATTGWLQYQFPAARIVTQYAVTSLNNATTYAPKTWTFKGSNNGTTWVTLDTRADITDWATGGPVRKVLPFANATAYLYYRLDITASNDASYVAVGELEMMETVETARWFRRRGRNGQPDRFMRMKG